MYVLSGVVYDYACSVLPNLPGNYFEIGVFNGTGFARVARENPEKKCYAVDPFIEDGHTNASSGQPTGSLLNQQKLNFLESTKGLENITLHEMTSIEFSGRLTVQLVDDMNISVVAIDGNHHYDHVINDLAIAIKLISRKHGYIIVDDTDVEGVGHAYEEFVKSFYHRIDHEISPGGSTKALVIKAE